MRTIDLVADRSKLGPIFDQNTGRKPPFFFSGTPFNVAVSLRDNGAVVSDLKEVHIEFKRPNNQQPHSIPSPDDPVILKKTIRDDSLESTEPVVTLNPVTLLPPFPSIDHRMEIVGVLNPEAELGWVGGDILEVINGPGSFSFLRFSQPISIDDGGGFDGPFVGPLPPPDLSPQPAPPLVIPAGQIFADVRIDLSDEFPNFGAPLKVQRVFPNESQFHENLLFSFTAAETALCDEKMHVTIYAEHLDGTIATYLAGFLDVRRDGVHGPTCFVLPRLLFQQGAAIVGREGKVFLIYSDEQGVTSQLDLTAANGDMKMEDYDPDNDGSVSLADAIKGVSGSGNSIYYGTDENGVVGFHPLPISSGAGNGDMQKADYDADSDGKVDAAEHADTASSVTCVSQAAATSSSNTYYGTDQNGDEGCYSLPDTSRVVFSKLWGSSEGKAIYGQQYVRGMVAAIDSKGHAWSWGRQWHAGVLGLGSTGDRSGFVRRMSYQNSTSRPVPNLQPQRNFGNDQVAQLLPSYNQLFHLTENGVLYVNGEGGYSSSSLGQDSSDHQTIATAIRFGNSENTIRLGDVRCDISGNREVDAIFIDQNNHVWIVGFNWASFNLSVGSNGRIPIPLDVTASISSWTNKVPKKVQTSGVSSFVALFEDGELWATAYNSNGWAGTGGTGNLPNFIQIATGIEDCILVSDFSHDHTALYTIDAGGTVKAAGRGGAGQLGQGNTQNQRSFVTVETEVERFWIGGYSDTWVIFEKVDGSYTGCGWNNRNQLGLGNTTNQRSPVSLGSLNDIATDHSGISKILPLGLGNDNATFILCNDGTGWASGYNSHGELGVGDTQNLTNTSFRQILFQLEAGEKVIDLAAAVYSSAHAVWLTDKGRILMSGENAYGFSHGISPHGDHGNKTVPEAINL